MNDIELAKEAKRIFLHTVSLDARYSVAEGGRTVAIPFSYLFNNIYSNLNQINQTANPSIPAYPQIETPQLNFVRSPEQQTKLITSMPIFNATIIQNQKIKKGLSEVESMSIDLYKRELVKEVEAYVKCLQEEQLYVLLTNTLKQ